MHSARQVFSSSSDFIFFKNLEALYLEKDGLISECENIGVSHTCIPVITIILRLLKVLFVRCSIQQKILPYNCKHLVFRDRMARYFPKRMKFNFFEKGWSRRIVRKHSTSGIWQNKVVEWIWYTGRTE